MGMSAVLTAICCFAFVQIAFTDPRCTFLKDKPENSSKPFPNIEKLAVESYQLSVEYTVPKEKQTDYYVEYFDLVERQGKVEVHQAGESSSYLYKATTQEAWEISQSNCTLKYSNSTPEMLRDFMTDWRYMPVDQPDLITVGPSAMFKIAFDIWNSSSENMVYMGKFEGGVRGLSAEYWRRCNSDNSYVDYYFSTAEDDDEFEERNWKTVPLRVYFDGEPDSPDLSKQQYEIMYFQPYISTSITPFNLPKGKGCKRFPSDEYPDMPVFSDKNFQFAAEVIYRKIDRTGDDAQYTSYYSTLMMALDQGTSHLAYYYTPWDTTKKDDDDIGDPEYVIYDMKNMYAYVNKIDDGTCNIVRDRHSLAIYALPEDAGEIFLDDPAILFPNNEMVFLSEGTTRGGIKVNIFERVSYGYLIGKRGDIDSIEKAIISHSYLQDNEIERNVGSVKNALVQVQLLLTRDSKTKVFEILTFNFYGFTTQLRDKRKIFNIEACFKNDDDYLWATIGFNADPANLDKVKNDVPSIKDNMLGTLQVETELNAVRVPIIMVDVADGLFVTMFILNKPPVTLDYEDSEEGMSIESKEMEGISSSFDCATKCLENEDNCWGYSMCGAVCIFGTGEAQVVKKEGCQLYRRFDNETFIPSMESMVQTLRNKVARNEIHLMLKDKDDNEVQLDASSIQITEPGEDDALFDQIGNALNPRMIVKKVGYKLKPVGGTPVKNLGRIRYDECQRLCLDFKVCETISYCLRDSQCLLSDKYFDDITNDTMEEDFMCNVVTRKYGDNFQRSAGNVLVETAQEVLDFKDSEQCARACLKSTKFQCLSFDHCPREEKGGCKLHTVHYPNPKTRESKQTNSSNCGHYFRKFSTEFKRNPEKQSVGSKIPPITNLTLEECSKNCFEYGKGTCYGFDFCQDSSMLATSCQLLDTLDYQTNYKKICDNFRRDAPGLAETRPYTNGYAGGIGFICFIVGLLVGAAVVFTIAYMRVNRR